MDRFSTGVKLVKWWWMLRITGGQRDVAYATCVGNKAPFSFRKTRLQRTIHLQFRERERRRGGRVYLAGRDEVRQKGGGISSVWARDKTGTGVCVCARQKSAVKKHTRRYTAASRRRQWPPRGKVSITGGGRDNGHSKKRMFGPHNDGQRNDLSAYMLHTAACYKYPDVCPMDLDGGRINRLSRENLEARWKKICASPPDDTGGTIYYISFICSILSPLFLSYMHIWEI